jgi:hypothetical protein
MIITEEKLQQIPALWPFIPSQESENRIKFLTYILDKYPFPEGLVFEFGVCTGATIRVISSKIPTHKIYGFDNFDGLPEDWDETVVIPNWLIRRGAFRMRDYVHDPNSFPENIEIIIGLIQDTLPPFLIKHPEPAGFIHIDTDLFSTCKNILDNLTRQIVAGTIILFDEFWSWNNDKIVLFSEGRAYNEWAEKNNKDITILGRTDHSQLAIQVL